MEQKGKALEQKKRGRWEGLCMLPVQQAQMQELPRAAPGQQQPEGKAVGRVCVGII